MFHGITLSRYFGMRFISAVLAVFCGLIALTVLIDYVELMRRASEIPNVSALLVAKTSIYRVPQVAERLMPFCVLIGAMSCYLTLSRRLELVIARAAGVSAWQFISPAIIAAFLIGVLATAIYNPVSAILQEQSKRLEAQLFGQPTSTGGAFWVRQRTDDGQAIIGAQSSQQQGAQLNGVSVFAFDNAGRYQQRYEARTAILESSTWRLIDVREYPSNAEPHDRAEVLLPTNLTREQVRESFATPETVPFWDLPQYIGIAEKAGLAAAGYRLQFHKLLAKPFLLAAMVFLAAAVSLRFFRFGGVQKMVLSGVASGFLLYVFSKVTDDMAKAELMHPVAAAWLPVLVGGITGFVALLYQEDG
ncbi:MAG: LPS export ABC transporter permease LptG [Pseudolabrys sp.]|nr:LPS export ABC transporter permease LptG [Pseudolabrys sp.]